MPGVGSRVSVLLRDGISVCRARGRNGKADIEGDWKFCGPLDLGNEQDDRYIKFQKKLCDLIRSDSPS